MSLEPFSDIRGAAWSNANTRFEVLGDVTEGLLRASTFNGLTDFSKANLPDASLPNRILEQAKKHDVVNEDMPTHILIISDMEFDRCVRNGKKTIFENAKDRFNRYGYDLPTVVFWNVDARSENLPVRYN